MQTIRLPRPKARPGVRPLLLTKKTAGPAGFLSWPVLPGPILVANSRDDHWRYTVRVRQEIDECGDVRVLPGSIQNIEHRSTG
jgi:hypothetical protein